MSWKAVQKTKQSRRSFTAEFQREAVARLWEGHSAPSVAERLGLSNPSRWSRGKSSQREQSGPVAASLEARVPEREVALARVTRERDSLKKSVGHFRPGPSPFSSWGATVTEPRRGRART